MQLHMQEIAQYGLAQITIYSKKLLLVLLLEHPNFCRVSIGLDLSNFHMNQAK